MQGYLVSVLDYNFKITNNAARRLAISRGHMSISVEINEMKVILAEKIDTSLLQKRKFKNRDTGEVSSY